MRPAYRGTPGYRERPLWRRKRTLALRAREIQAYALNYARQNPASRTRVLLFSQGRAGSTLLENLLGSTGHFHENGELLNTGPGEVLFPLQFLDGWSKRKTDKHFICHVKIYHLTRDRKRPIDPENFIQALYARGFKIIYLRRRNVLKQCLSNIAALQQRRFHTFEDTRRDSKITVKCDRYARMVSDRLRYLEMEKNLLSKFDHHKIVYEDDLENSAYHQKTVDKVLDYLSLERRMATTEHRKLNTRSMRESISNYDEFVACVRQNGWESFLDGSDITASLP